MTTTAKTGDEAVAFACSLTSTQRIERKESFEELLAGAGPLMELEDGYAFAFPSDARWVRRITEFIIAERQCCPFFSFSLDFERTNGPVRLSIQGQEGIKEILREGLLRSHTSRG